MLPWKFYTIFFLHNRMQEEWMFSFEHSFYHIPLGDIWMNPYFSDTQWFFNYTMIFHVMVKSLLWPVFLSCWRIFWWTASAILRCDCHLPEKWLIQLSEHHCPPPNTFCLPHFGSSSDRNSSSYLAITQMLLESHGCSYTNTAYRSTLKFRLLLPPWGVQIV